MEMKQLKSGPELKQIIEDAGIVTGKVKVEVTRSNRTGQFHVEFFVPDFEESVAPAAFWQNSIYENLTGIEVERTFDTPRLSRKDFTLYANLVAKQTANVELKQAHRDTKMDAFIEMWEQVGEMSRRSGFKLGEWIEYY